MSFFLTIKYTTFHWKPENTAVVHRVFEHRGSVAMASMLLRAKELGYDPGIAETFRRTHSIKQKDNKRETFKAKWSEAHSSEGGKAPDTNCLKKQQSTSSA
ncbi:hypothetical protein Tsubulata_044740 [Turnera subulata]|uniref:Uncharacterized protein n=1 Tax=Turnera subulata TaxID=218843 RepID=A0A9Q0JMZ2_9ROSI|nr:hypothetical protein Tsubulata_044740 [Turnera subulata]